MLLVDNVHLKYTHYELFMPSNNIVLALRVNSLAAFSEILA